MTFQHLEVTPTAGDQRRFENKAQIGPDTLVGRYSGGQTEMSPLMRQLKNLTCMRMRGFSTLRFPRISGHWKISCGKSGESHDLDRTAVWILIWQTYYISAKKRNKTVTVSRKYN